MAKKEKISFLFSYKYIEYFKDLTGEETKQILNDMVEYDKNDVEPQYQDRVLKTIWNLIKTDMKENKEKYKEKCLKNSENQKERWRQKQENMQLNTSVYERTKKQKNDTNDTDIDKDIDIYNMCVYKEENIKEESSENFNCHLGRDSKIESCADCAKNQKCPFKTDSHFQLEKGCSFEEWLEKRKKLAEEIINSKHDPPDMNILEDYNYFDGENDE